MHDAPHRCLSRPTPAKTLDIHSSRWPVERFTLQLVNRPFVNITAAEPMRTDEIQAATKRNPMPVGGLPAAFGERHQRRLAVEIPRLPSRVRCPTHAPGWGCAHQSRKEQILASARHETVTLNFSRPRRPAPLATEECGIILLRPAFRPRGGILRVGSCRAPAAQRRSCAHRCHRELAILRLARLR